MPKTKDTPKLKAKPKAKPSENAPATFVVHDGSKPEPSPLAPAVWKK